VVSRLGLLLRRMHSGLLGCIISVVKFRVTSRDMQNTAVLAKSCARSLLAEMTNRRSRGNMLIRKQAWTKTLGATLVWVAYLSLNATARYAQHEFRLGCCRPKFS